MLHEALDLLRQMDPPGRVLQKKKYLKDEYWVELEDKKAIEKIRYYCFRNGHDACDSGSEVSPTQIDSCDNSTDITTGDHPTLQATILEKKDESEMLVSSESERDEVTDVLNSMVKVVESVGNDEALSTHTDEDWLIEEKHVRTLLQEAFKQANVTSDTARWNSLQEHSVEIRGSFMSESTFLLWWNHFDSRTGRLQKRCIEVMTSFCRQQRMASYYSKDLAVLAPPGKLGIVLEEDNTGCTPIANVVGRLRISSVMANQICLGDRLVAIDDEDVSQMSVKEISEVMARKSDDEKVLVIKPSLISTIEFTKRLVAPPSFQSNIEILLFTYVKAHIAANRLRYNEVRVLLQLPPFILCEEVGGKLSELHAQYGAFFDRAWKSVISKLLANWWATVIDSKRLQSEAKAFIATVPDDTTSSTLDSSICKTKIQEVCDCIKAHITANAMQYEDVSELLHLRPSSVLEVVRKLHEVHNELGANKFGVALSLAKKHVLYWFESRNVSTSDKSDPTNVCMEAIIEGRVIRVKVTQDSSQESTAIQNRNCNDSSNGDKHKIVDVIEQAARLPHCEKTQKRCLSEIRKCVANEELKSLTLHNMFAHAVTNALKAHSGRSNISADALATLSQILWSFPASSKQMVEEEGCLQLALNAMEMHTSHSNTQQSACELFVALSYDKTCCQAMLDSDVISAVLASIKRCLKKSQSRAMSSGLLFLQNMAVISLDVVEAIMREENVLSALLRTIQTKTSNTNLLISLFGFLSNIAIHTEVRSQIANEGGVEIILDKLAAMKNEQLLLLALKTLLNLALNKTVVKSLIENCCAKEVIAHANARASRENPDLLLISLGLLDKLIDTEVAANQNEVASGAESIALAALRDHPNNKQIRSVAISLLQKSLSRNFLQ